MKNTAIWFLGADLCSTITYYLLQTNIPDFVVDNTVKMAAAIFVGFIGGFMGVIGKKVGEDYLKEKKRKKDAKNHQK